MGWLRRSEEVAARTDPLASWGERAWSVVLVIFGPSALVGLGAGAYGWVTANPLYGIAFGFLAFALIQAALTLRAIRQSAAKRGPFAEAESETAELGSDSLRLPADVAADSYIADREFRITELLQGDKDPVVRDKTIQRCTIHGPAVLFVRGCTLSDISLIDVIPGQTESLLWDIDTERTQYVTGAIMLDGCIVSKCTFTGIGFTGPPEDMQKIRDILPKPERGE